MAQIVCPACGSAVAPADVDLSTKLAKCGCGNVFDFGNQVKKDTADRRRELAAPDGLVVTIDGARDDGNDNYRTGRQSASRSLVYRWFVPQALFLVFFCIFWNGFLVVWYGISLEMLADGGMGAAALLPLLFPLLHVGVGVGLTYYTAALFLNRTTIVMTRDQITVQHGPLPWRDRFARDVSGLRAVFVRVGEGSRKERGQPTWSVFLDTAAAPSLLLVRGLRTEEHARCIAAHVAEQYEVDSA